MWLDNSDIMAVLHGLSSCYAMLSRGVMHPDGVACGFCFIVPIFRWHSHTRSEAGWRASAVLFWYGVPLSGGACQMRSRYSACTMTECTWLGLLGVASIRYKCKL